MTNGMLSRALVRARIGDLAPLRNLIQDDGRRAEALVALARGVRDAHPRHPIHAFALEQALAASGADQGPVRAAGAALLAQLTYFSADPVAEGRLVNERLCALLRDPSPEVQVATATALGRTVTPREVPALTGALAQAATPSARAAMVTALGLAGAPSAVPTIAAALAEPTLEVRRAAVQALHECGAPAGAACLREAMACEADVGLREYMRCVADSLDGHARQVGISDLAALLGRPSGHGIERWT